MLLTGLKTNVAQLFVHRVLLVVQVACVLGQVQAGLK